MEYLACPLPCSQEQRERQVMMAVTIQQVLVGRPMEVAYQLCNLDSVARQSEQVPDISSMALCHRELPPRLQSHLLAVLLQHS